jgi:hypothetical protein
LLLLLAWQPGRLLVALAPGLLDPQGSPGPTSPAGPTGPASTVPSISGVPLVPVISPSFQELFGEAFTWGGFALASVGVLLLGWVMLNRHFTEYAITTSPRSAGTQETQGTQGTQGTRGSQGFGGRIIKVQGVLSRQTVTVPLGMVNDLVLYEPLLGRILGWGHIDIETGNDYTGDHLEYVPDPRGFQMVWKELLDNVYGDQKLRSGA